MSKGSRPRPLSVDQKTFDNNWDNIFRNQKNENIKTKKNAKTQDACQVSPTTTREEGLLDHEKRISTMLS